MWSFQKFEERDQIYNKVSPNYTHYKCSNLSFEAQKVGGEPKYKKVQDFLPWPREKIL